MSEENKNKCPHCGAFSQFYGPFHKKDCINYSSQLWGPKKREYIIKDLDKSSKEFTAKSYEKISKINWWTGEGSSSI